MRAQIVNAAALRHLIAIHGGFTVGSRDGQAVENGISVCTRPSRSLTFQWTAWDNRHVDGWIAERSAEYGWRSRHIGGWLDPRSNTVWLDVVRVVPPRLRPAACLVGFALQQHCVFDLGRRETVTLRGSAA